MDRDDPQHDVDAPVRRALLTLVARGVALVGIVLALVLAPKLPPLAGFAGLNEFVLIVVPLVLLGSGVVALVERRTRGRPPEETRAVAWFKAREVEPADTMLALLVAGWVPVSLLAALVVLAWPNLHDPSVSTRATFWVIGIPGLGAAWIVATALWLDATRDQLARAVGESERRFRSYWANPGA